MGKILFSGSFGSDDPTRATLPFLAASGALDRGHEPVIFLMGEAVYVMKDEVADVIQGVGIPSLRTLIDKAVEHDVPIYI
jgi:uncharacterized protein involved in oxidation of intracellular sulfur